jgi:tripartite-type tricarboxylate transporter receptor subunit TctC
MEQIQKTRRRAALALAAGSLLATVAGSVAAQDAWPTKPIRYIVPFAPGGTTDILARVVGEKLGVALGQTIVVDNRPGQGGSAGAAELARAAPDGYTIGGGTISSHAINATLYGKLPYDPVTSFAPITSTPPSRTCCSCIRACRPATCASSSPCSRPIPRSTASAPPGSAPRSTSVARCSSRWPG